MIQHMVEYLTDKDFSVTQEEVDSLTALSDVVL